MDAKVVIKALMDIIEQSRKQGVEVIRLTDVQNLLNDLNQRIVSAESQPVQELPPDIALTQWKMQHEINLAQYITQYRASTDTSLELLRSVILSGQAALKSAILINGGAAVALLAFIGRIWETQPSRFVVSGLTSSLLAFVYGVLAAAAATGTTYLAQFFYNYNLVKTGHITNIISITLVIISYILFGYFGCYKAYLAFIAHLK
jgi:hypothetical protein